jgi:hypothetical protein
MLCNTTKFTTVVIYIDWDSYYYQCARHSIGVGCTGVL